MRLTSGPAAAHDALGEPSGGMARRRHGRVDLRLNMRDHGPGFRLREYIGISRHGNTVYTAFTGLHQDDSQANKSLIFTTLIGVP